MVFDRSEVDKLLANCNRCCCICHRFCGIKIETDHIHPRSESNDDTIENAIPLCFNCHAEVHMYNNNHPKGRKYTSEELMLHKKHWLKICESNSNSLVDDLNPSNGTLSSLIDELEFNKVIAINCKNKTIEIPFEINQFHATINAGIISFLEDKVKYSIFRTYVLLKQTNILYKKYANLRNMHGTMHIATNDSGFSYDTAIQESLKAIKDTLRILLEDDSNTNRVKNNENKRDHTEDGEK